MCHPFQGGLECQVSQQLPRATWLCPQNACCDAHRRLWVSPMPAAPHQAHGIQNPPESSSPPPTQSSSPSSQKPRSGPVLPSGLPAVAGLTTTFPPQLLSPQVPCLPWSPHSHIPPTNLFSSFSLNSRLSLGLPAPVLQPASRPCPRSPAWLLQGPSGSGCHLPSHLTCHVPPNPESACTTVMSQSPSRPPNLLFLLFPKTLPFLSNYRALQAALLAWSHPPVASFLSQLLRAICKHNSLHRAPSVCR